MFICMQKINFISNFLKNHSINLQETFLMLICIQKINFIIHFFLKILQNSKLVILSNLGMPGHTHLKWLYHFEEAFDVYLRQKINFILHVFLLRYCKDIANFLFLVFLVCLITHTQNSSINLQKTFVFISMPKINFIIHLHFKESSNLIGQKHFDHNLRTRILQDMGLVIKYQKQH